MRRWLFVGVIAFTIQLTACSRKPQEEQKQSSAEGSKLTQAVDMNTESGPTPEAVREQITAWYNNSTIEFFGAKVSPTSAAELVEVYIKDSEVQGDHATVQCDLTFRMKVDYEGGPEHTPISLLGLGLGFEESQAKSNEKKTLSSTFPFEKKETRWQLEEYRKIVSDDNLICGARIDTLSSSFGGLPEGYLVSFECVDKNGKTVQIELASKKLSKGRIETKQFGTIRMKSKGTVVDYYMTESQIRRIKKYLGW